MFEGTLFMEVSPSVKVVYGVERQRVLENRLKEMKKDKNKKKIKKVKKINKCKCKN